MMKLKTHRRFNDSELNLVFTLSIGWFRAEIHDTQVRASL